MPSLVDMLSSSKRGVHRRHLVSGVLFVVGLGVLYLIAAVVNDLPPFGSATHPQPDSGAGELAARTTAAQGPGTTMAATNALSLNELMPDQGCDQPPTNVTQGFAGLTNALQCTNDPNLPSVVVAGFQFNNASDFAAALRHLNMTIGFNSVGASSSCPPSGSTSGVNHLAVERLSGYFKPGP